MKFINGARNERGYGTHAYCRSDRTVASPARARGVCFTGVGPPVLLLRCSTARGWERQTGRRRCAARHSPAVGPPIAQLPPEALVSLSASVCSTDFGRGPADCPFARRPLGRGRYGGQAAHGCGAEARRLVVRGHPGRQKWRRGMAGPLDQTHSPKFRALPQRGMTWVLCICFAVRALCTRCTL